jgi:hypothetical protein
MIMVKALPNSQAHLQFAQAMSESKNCKRACLSATAEFADTKKLNLFKTEKQNERIDKLAQSIDSQERPVGNKGCNQYGLNELRERFGTQGAS